jgi:hypothetical protein
MSNEIVGFELRRWQLALWVVILHGTGGGVSTLYTSTGTYNSIILPDWYSAPILLEARGRGAQVIQEPRGVSFLFAFTRRQFPSQSVQATTWDCTDGARLCWQFSYIAVSLVVHVERPGCRRLHV